MTILNFLEQLATQAHHSSASAQLISSQSIEVQKAFLTNDASLLRSQFSDKGYLAHEEEVAQI